MKCRFSKTGRLPSRDLNSPGFGFRRPGKIASTGQDRCRSLGSGRQIGSWVGRAAPEAAAILGAASVVAAATVAVVAAAATVAVAEEAVGAVAARVRVVVQVGQHSRVVCERERWVWAASPSSQQRVKR